MAGKTLVALDGSRTSESVLPYVEALLRNEDADVTFAMAVPDDTLRHRQAARSYLRAAALRMAEKGAFADFRILVGEPAGALVRFAEAEGYKRLVLCSHGKSGVRRILLGSVAEKVLRTSRRLVLVVHPRSAAEPAPALKRIVLAVDGSRRSLTAERPVAELAQAQDAAMLLVNVVASSGREELPVGVVAENVFQAQRRLKALGLQAKVAVLFGEPVAEILKYAEKAGADLIAVATHGRRGAQRLLHGSVAEQLLRKGTFPLLVVRSGATPRTQVRGVDAVRARRRSLEVMSERSMQPASPYRR